MKIFLKLCTEYSLLLKLRRKK
jgi:hypothetical protein